MKDIGGELITNQIIWNSKQNKKQKKNKQEQHHTPLFESFSQGWSIIVHAVIWYYDNWTTGLNDTLVHSGWTFIFFHHFDLKVGHMIISQVDMGELTRYQTIGKKRLIPDWWKTSMMRCQKILESTMSLYLLWWRGKIVKLWNIKKSRNQLCWLTTHTGGWGKLQLLN